MANYRGSGKPPRIRDCRFWVRSKGGKRASGLLCRCPGHLGLCGHNHNRLMDRCKLAEEKIPKVRE